MRGHSALAFAIGITAITMGVHGSAEAQEPKLPAVDPSAIQAPQAKLRQTILPFTVRLARQVARPLKFSDGSVQGECSGKICTVTAAAGVSEMQVCRTLRGRFGRIDTFARGTETLTSSELTACNARNAGIAANAGNVGKRPTPPDADLPAVTPREGLPGLEEAPTEVITPTDLREVPAEVVTPSDLKEAPGEVVTPSDIRTGAPPGGRDIRTPEGLPEQPPGAPEGGAPGVGEMDRRRGTAEAVQALREDLARRGSAPEITGFEAYPCLPASNDTLRIEGRRFGATAGFRRVVLGQDPPRGRPFEVRWALSVLIWRDDQIDVALPRELPPGRWAVAIADRAGEPISNLRSFSRCPGSFRISGRIDMQSCGASLGDIRVSVVHESPGGSTIFDAFSVGPDPSNDLAFRYDEMVGPGEYQLTPRLTGDICPGGSWSPESYSVRVSELDGSPGAPRSDYDFTYTNVALTVTRIPGVILIGVIQNLFDGIELRLNNSGPESPRGSWYKPDDSWIRLPEALGGTELPLDIPAGRGGVYQYYVQDVNLSNISVRQQGDAVAIRLRFENGGVELKGYCWGTRSAFDLDCPVGPDDTAPDVQVDNLLVSILLPPARFVPDRGPVGISYGEPRVTATADVQARGVCEVVDVCRMLIDYEELILTGIEEGLESLLAQRWVRETVAEGIGTAMATGGFAIGDVNRVGFEGSDLVIRHRPR